MKIRFLICATGIDNTVPMLVGLSGTALAQDSYRPFDRIYFNRFLRLEGEKFLTSRNHVIWALDIKRHENVNADLLRAYLESIMSEVVHSKQALPINTFVMLLVSGVLLATCYGSTFMLADYLSIQGLEPTKAGTAVSAGIIVTLMSALFAGRVAERIGLGASLAVASLLMAIAMFGFSVTGDILGAIYIGGVFLGAAWAIFYILAPLIVINSVASTARLKYLTYLSGAQMLGLGLSAPTGNLLVSHGISHGEIYTYLAVFAVICSLLLFLVGRSESRAVQTAHRLTMGESMKVLGQSTVYPIVIIGLLACIFSGLATFQSLYANTRGFDPSTFFLVFTVVTVVLRFGVASQIAKLPIYKLAIGLIVLILFSLALLILNDTNHNLYILSSAIFATGYGLSYSTLNAIVVNNAEEKGLSTSSASQVFTLCYFVGIFGFPIVAGLLIRSGAINAMLLVTILIAVCALFIAIRLWAKND